MADLDLGPTSEDWVWSLAAPTIYQERVKTLTAELKDCRQTLADERCERRREVDQLRGMLREGLSPEILQLRKDVSRWRGRAQAAELRLREARRTGGIHGSR